MKNGVYKNSNKFQSHSLWKDIVFGKTRLWLHQILSPEEYCLTGLYTRVSTKYCHSFEETEAILF